MFRCVLQVLHSPLWHLPKLVYLLFVLVEEAVTQDLMKLVFHCNLSTIL